MKYIEVEGYKNILQEIEDHYVLPSTYLPSLNVTFGRLVRMLASRNPKWKFIKKWVSYGVTNAITKLDIYQDDEPLGWVRISSDNYEFDNPRLKAARQRGSCKYTKNRNVALKQIEENFYPKTDVEVMEEAQVKAANTARACGNKLVQDFNMTMNSLDTDIRNYALKNWSVIGPHVTDAATVAEVPKLQERSTHGYTIINTTYANTASIVLIRGERYLTKSMGTVDITPYTTDTLPPYIKGAIGMLKLLEGKGEYIPDVGVRVDNSTFFILPEKETK